MGRKPKPRNTDAEIETPLNEPEGDCPADCTRNHIHKGKAWWRAEESTEQPKIPGFKVNGAEGQGQPQSGGTIGAERLSFKLTPDGRIDANSLQDRTKQRLAEFFRNPQNYADMLPEGSRTKMEIISPEQIKPVWTGIGLINVFLAVKVAHIPPELAHHIFPYNKEETDLLADASAECLNEFADKLPAWFLNLLQKGGSMSLAKLAMIVYQIHANKIEQLKLMLQQPGPQADQPRPQ